MRKIKKICILFVFTLVLCMNYSFATSQMEIISDNSEISSNEEIQISIRLKDIQVAAFTLEIFWDGTKLDYVEGPENANYLNNRILYTWVNDTGTNVNDITTEKLKFKAIQDGTANIVVTGEFYNANGKEVEIEEQHLEINIGNQMNEQTEQNDIEQQEEVGSNNTELSVLRLNHEGISPQFDSSIQEYYFIAEKEINRLEVTAVPKNKNATVVVTGNSQLKMGQNTINIKVESEDKTRNATYKIYVTRTDDIEKTNANLETLAIRQAILNPEFDNNMTKYTAEIANDIDTIDLLAIPQKENASVEVLGNGQMQIGDNVIQVIVEAENGITTKKYEIVVHRRNKEEEAKYQEEQEVQIEKLSAILEEQNEEDEENSITQEEKRKSQIIIAIMVILIIVIITGIIFLKVRKNKRTIKKL